MDGEAWWATVHGVAKSQTRLSDFTFTFLLVGNSQEWEAWPAGELLVSLSLSLLEKEGGSEERGWSGTS